MKERKRNVRKAIAVVLSAVCIFSLICTNSTYVGFLTPVLDVEAAENVSNGTIANPSFENSDLDLGDYWSVTETGAGSYEVDTTKSYAGTNSFKVEAVSRYQATVTQEINNLTPGYYYLTAYVLSTDSNNYAYLFGNGSKQGKCMTYIPVADDWKLVTVRGISVEEDGTLTIGMNFDLNSGCYVNVDSIKLCYENNQETQYESLFGGAISKLDWIEDEGGLYYDKSGAEGDALQQMAEYGCNFVRLEMYNNTGKRDTDSAGFDGGYFPEGYINYDSMLELGKRATAKNMKVELSFMYSDYWGNEAIPSDWLEKIEGMTDTDKIVDTLTQCIYEYTKECMQGFLDEGIVPAYVSLGNEMQGGILLPYGSSYTSTTTQKAMAKFLNAGYEAVKEVSPESKVVLHIAGGCDDTKYTNKSGQGKWFFNICKKYSVNYDIIGASYYPFWSETQSVEDLTEWCELMIDTFDKDVLIMESGYDFYELTAQGYTGQLSNGGYYDGIYDFSPEGQKDFCIDLINAIKNVKDGRCVGDLYWDPTFVYQEGVGTVIDSETDEATSNVISNTTFWDFNHVALPVFDAYKYNTVGGDFGILSGSIEDSQGNLVANTSVTFNFDGTEIITTTDRYGTFYIHSPVLDSGTVTVTAEEKTETAIYSGFSLDYGEEVKANIKLGDNREFEAATDTIIFHYYSESSNDLYVVFENNDVVATTPYTFDGQNAYAMTNDGDGWFSIEYKSSYGGITVIEGVTDTEDEWDLSTTSKVLTEFSDTENANLYLKLQDGYYTYYKNNHMYHDPSKLTDNFYIVGSTTEWDSSKPGIFSNYWASGGKWLDKLEIDENGYYSITLGVASPDYEYSYCIYQDASWSNKILGNRTFTVDKTCNVTFILDPETLMVTYEFEPVSQILDEGDGTKESPYLIYNYEQLCEFANVVNGNSDFTEQNLSACAKLMSDVTANENVLLDGVLNTANTSLDTWIPIGTLGNVYTGTFDGNGHVISGLYFSGSGAYKGFVGYLGDEGIVKNLGITDTYFKAVSRLGGIAGYAVNANIVGCYVQGYIYASNSSLTYVGGIAGYSSSTEISNCYTAGTVKGTNYVGAIAGISRSSSIENCYYLEGTSNGGINSKDVDDAVMGKNETEFASGEVAYLLNPELYGQDIGTDALPAFLVTNGNTANGTMETDKNVYKVQIYSEETKLDAYYCNDDMPVYVAGDTCEIEKEGYEFVDLYFDVTLNQIVDTEVTVDCDTNLYARFVSDEVLTAKVQMKNNITTESDYSVLRFVATVDNLDYDKVGFNMYYVSGTTIVDKAVESTNVYRRIKANGAYLEPGTAFCSNSKYFVTYTINKIPNVAFSTKIVMTPYVVTKTGRVVTGVAKTVSVSDLIK